jgi:DNA-binding LacI/PurR family transcriptional regulator
MTTLEDVARRVGVTPATVSNVITGKGSVSEKTRVRVYAAIEELGYQPNLVARGLARRKTFTLALVLLTIANPFYAEIAEEVECIARQHGYQLLLCNTHKDAMIGREHLKGLSSRWVDGLLVMGGSLPAADMQIRRGHRGQPMVLCIRSEEEQNVTLPVVDIDFRHAGELAAQHLLELGHRTFAVIVETPSHILRLEGFRSALAASGIALPDIYIQRGDSSMQSGYEATMALLALPSRPSAIFATNDLMALGAVEAAIDHGLRVPDDLSVIGLDDIMLGMHVRPPLTTVAIPKQELARQAIELLLRYIDDTEAEPVLLTVRPHLVIRRSTAKPGEGSKA